MHLLMWVGQIEVDDDVFENFQKGVIILVIFTMALACYGLYLELRYGDPDSEGEQQWSGN